MKLARHLPDAASSRRSVAPIAALVALLSVGLVVPLGGAHAATTVPIGTAASFAILAGSTITNTGPSVVEGDIGLHPGTAVTGFGPGADAVTHSGALHVADAAALQAKLDLDTAATDAAGRSPATEIPTELGGSSLTPGVYESASGTFGITGPLTLDGGGDPDAVFIFQAASTLVTASASSVVLANGADACNVFWQVGSSATLGTGSTFRGTILAAQSVTLGQGVTVEGRVLAGEAAVTMDTNVITAAACSADDGATDDGTTDDGTTDGATDDGTTDGATDDGTTDGATDDGTTDDDATDGATDDGTTDDGTTDDDGETPDPTTPEPITPEPITPEPTTPEPTSPEPNTPDPTTPESGTPDQDTQDGGTTTSQVRRVPEGPVAAGAGPRPGPGGSSPLLTAAWMIPVAGALAARRSGAPRTARA